MARCRLSGLAVVVSLTLLAGAHGAPLPTSREQGQMEVSIPIKKAVIHGMTARPEDMQVRPAGVAVLDLPAGREEELAQRYRDALSAGPERVGRLPADARLRILSAGPKLNSPDTLAIRRLVRKRSRLELELDYTDVVAEGAQLLRNVPHYPLVEVPLDLPPGGYEVYATWTVVPARLAWVKNPQPLTRAPTTYTYAFVLGRAGALRTALGPDIAWGEPVDGIRLGLAPPALTLRPGMKELRVQVWYENVSQAAKQVMSQEETNTRQVMFAGLKAGKPFYADYTGARVSPSVERSVTLQPGTRYHEELEIRPGDRWDGLVNLPGLESGEQLALQAGYAARPDTKGASSWEAADTRKSGSITLRRAKPRSSARSPE